MKIYQSGDKSAILGYADSQVSFVKILFQTKYFLNWILTYFLNWMLLLMKKHSLLQLFNDLHIHLNLKQKQRNKQSTKIQTKKQKKQH